MKLFKIIIYSITAVTACAVNTSCKREIPQLASIQTDFSNSASVQVFSATVKATRNYVYVDAVPVSGAAVAFGGVFPGTAYSFKVNAGSRSVLIKDTLGTSTQTPLTFSQSFDAGKSYTIFTYDTITSVKQSTVVNNIVIPSDTSAMFRFANFIYNATAVPNVDVYSFKKGTTPLFTNVATNAVTDFVPYPSLVSDTIYIYATGTTSPVLLKATVPSLTPTRSYTFAYAGSYRGVRVASVFTTY